MEQVKRYQVGYNRPIEGAFGNSPQEFHLVGETDDPLDAIAIADNLHRNADGWGRKAFIFDSKYKGLATIVTGPPPLPTRLITYVDGRKVDEQTTNQSGANFAR